MTFMNEVVAVIFERFGDRLADSLRRGEMDHRVELVPFEDPAERFAVAAVGLDEGDLRPRDAADPLDGGDVAVRKVIDDDHVVARGDQLHGGMRSDVAGAAADQNTRFFHSVAFSCSNSKDRQISAGRQGRRGKFHPSRAGRKHRAAPASCPVRGAATDGRLRSVTRPGEKSGAKVAVFGK